MMVLTAMSLAAYPTKLGSVIATTACAAVKLAAPMIELMLVIRVFMVAASVADAVVPVILDTAE